jgi:hypothetical protein
MGIASSIAEIKESKDFLESLDENKLRLIAPFSDSPQLLFLLSKKV